MKYKIGIITPTYNRPDYLLRAHMSLGGDEKDYDWCHYVVDDGSKIDYADVFERCFNISGRLKTTRIINSGALIARNYAIEMALSEGCTHLTFLDDDCILAEGALNVINEKINMHKDSKWLLFNSKVEGLPECNVTNVVKEVSWFEDVVLKRKFGSDNLIVVDTALVGRTRFSNRVRNQREWKFFYNLSKKNDRVIVCSETLLFITYLPGGLTDQAENKMIHSDQILNIIDRAFSYWVRKPFNPLLVKNLIFQIVMSPLRLLYCAFKNIVNYVEIGRK